MTPQRHWQWQIIASAFLASATFSASSCRTEAKDTDTSRESFEANGGSKKNAVVSPVLSKQLALAPNTTDAKQILKALDGAISLRRKQLSGELSWFANYSLASELVEFLLTRAHFLATVSDFDEALALAKEVAGRHGVRKPIAHLLLGKALSAVHRFQDAELSLAAAAAGGMTDNDLRSTRASNLLATGKPTKALIEFEKNALARPTIGDLTNVAVALGTLGRTSAAEVAFTQALSGEIKGDPLPVARVFFQQGLLWERQGKTSLARQSYLAGLERFPFYAPLVSHLAALEGKAGNNQVAIDRLRQIVVRSEDPEHLGQLATLLARSGQSEEASRLHKRADAGYHVLLAKHQLAFADHAARYFLERSQADDALKLARVNLANRESDAALQLVLDAAIAAQGKSPSPATCEVATRGANHKEASAYLLFVAARVAKSCGNTALADRALARAEGALRAR